MNLPTRRAASALATGLLALIAASGCQESDPTSVNLSEYTAKTTGSAVDRWEYLGRLTQKFTEAEPTSPSEQKALLRAFTSALIQTCNTIIDDPKADPELQVQACKLLFTTYARLSKIDPTAIDQVIAATERIEASHPNTALGTMCAGERARVLGQVASTTPEPAKREKYAELVKAVIHAAGVKPPIDNAAEILANMAVDCEKQRLFDSARQIAATLVEKFPNDPKAKFAKGSMHRHDSKGKVLDDLAGVGLDGKPVSIKDHRGKVVLVVFWVSFLDGVVHEMEEAEAMRQRYDPKDFVVLGVCLEPDPEATEAVLKDKKIGWPQINSRLQNREMESDMTLRYGINLPSYKMVIDRDGKLVDYGFLMGDIRGSLEKLLPKPMDTPPEAATPTVPARPASAEPAKKE